VEKKKNRHVREEEDFAKVRGEEIEVVVRIRGTISTGGSIGVDAELPDSNQGAQH